MLKDITVKDQKVTFKLYFFHPLFIYPYVLKSVYQLKQKKKKEISESYYCVKLKKFRVIF